MKIFEYLSCRRNLHSTLCNVQIFIKNRNLHAYLSSGIKYENADVEHILLQRKVLLLLEVSTELTANLHKLRHCSCIEDSTNTPLVIWLAENYLASNNFTFNIESYKEFLLNHISRQALNYHDLDMSSSAILYSCFMTMERLLKDQLMLQDRNEDVTITELILLIEEIRKIPNSEIIGDVCSLEKLLNRDPAGEYPLMDQSSKDAYRTALCKTAAECAIKPTDLLTEILTKCEFASGSIPESHVGYYLLREGKSEILGNKANKNISIKHQSNAYSINSYGHLLLLVSGAISIAFYYFVFSQSPMYFSFLIIAIFILVMDSLDGSIGVLTNIFRRKRTFLSRDTRFIAEKPEKIIIGIPCIIDGRERVANIIESLQKNAERADYAHAVFVVMSDWVDSDSSNPTDEELELLNLLAENVLSLNRKFESKDLTKFILLHRKRVFSPAQRNWYGWERKRGKILQLINLINNQGSNFDFSWGNCASLRNSRFLIILDEDTRISKSTIKNLVSAMLHPLNYPTFDKNKNVVAGYGLASPSVFVDSEPAENWCVRHFLHTSMIFNERFSRVQLVGARSSLFDSFSETAFTGKGIYNIQTAGVALDNKLPAERVLSHDIVEGGILRTGYVAAASIVEKFPPTYSAYLRRLHRWMRGDWQNWLAFNRVKYRNAVGTTTKFLINTNLRKALLHPAHFITFLAYFFAPPDTKIYLLIFALIVSLLPSYIAIILELMSNFVYGAFLMRIYSPIQYFMFVHIQQFIRIYLLPNLTLVSIHAMLISLWRMLTGKNTLNWISSATLKERPMPLVTRPSLINWAALILATVGIYCGHLELLIAVFWIPFSFISKRIY